MSYLVQSGTSLSLFNPTTSVSTSITLPAGITLFGTQAQPCRAVVFTAGSHPIIVVVNGGTDDFFIDYTGTSYKLQLAPPLTAPTLTAGALQVSGTGLTGVYEVAVTFKIKDSLGNTIVESALGPPGTSGTLSNSWITMAAIPVSGDPGVNARGLYRTVSGGNVFYPWFDIDNNTDVTESRGGSDASLSLLPTAAIYNGAPPDLKLCASWNQTLWGVGRVNYDYLNWTEPGLVYAWSATNNVLVPPQSGDLAGITALIPRRDQLGIARTSSLDQITGSGDDTYSRNRLSTVIGCISQESVVIVRDVAYFLASRGIAEWSSEGVRYVSELQVDPWFTTDSYFNRSMFQYAQGRYNLVTDSYELLLAPVGSTAMTQWVSFNLKARAWFGPHITGAFTPTVAGNDSEYKGVLNSLSTSPLSVFGSTNGGLFQRDPNQIDDYGTPVAFQLNLPFLHGQIPDIEKVWGQPTIETQVEAGGTLYITPTVGELSDPPQAAMSHDLTIERERLPVLGLGRYAQLTLTHSGYGESLRLHGITIPFSIIGRR